jgi:lipopolysaccharide transport protein LptA
MKLTWLILLLALSGALIAQTSLPSSSSSTRPETYIDSDTADFDLQTSTAVYRGNVRVDDPQLKLTCDLLTAKRPASGGRIDRIVAETNVAIVMLDDKGQTNHATGDRLVYTYRVQEAATNEIALLTGNARMDSADGWLTADVIEWNFITKKLHAEGNFRSGPHPGANTNQPPRPESITVSP